MTRYYVCGDSWTVREIEPSTGYLLNDTVYEVGASPTLYEVELNTTENPEIAEKLGIRAVPTVHFYKDGALVASHMGVMQAEDVKSVLAEHMYA